MKKLTPVILPLLIILLLTVSCMMAACDPMPSDPLPFGATSVKAVTYHEWQQEYEHGIVKSKIYYDEKNKRVMQEDFLGKHHPYYMKDGTVKTVTTFGKDGKIIEIKTYDKDGKHLEVIMPEPKSPMKE